MKLLKGPMEKIYSNCELAKHNLMKIFLKKAFQRPILKNKLFKQKYSLGSVLVNSFFTNLLKTLEKYL